MSKQKNSSRCFLMLAVLAMAALLSTRTMAQTENILHTFAENNIDGYWPSGTLVFDGSGNLYGTTGNGGAFGPFGTVFQLKAAGGGVWNEEILHSFGSGTDGWGAYAGPTLDDSGNIFGTTGWGGAYNATGVGGTVYELIHGPGGFTEKVIHSFGSGTDGNRPNAAVVLDAAGNIYGTTLYGGTYGEGVVFELRPTLSGVWNEKILLNFNGTNGSTPGFLMFDAAGNLFGTAGGGAYGAGITYELTPRPGGVWTQRILHNFLGGSADGMSPGPLVFGPTGNLYGTTFYGGSSYNEGSLYELIPTATGAWKESVVPFIYGSVNQCYWPDGDLLIDASGALYGTCAYGGSASYGAVFKFSPGPSGHWTETLLHDFGSGTDGQIPTGGLTFDAAGNIYGTTYSSSPYVCQGILGCGTAFELVP